MSILIISDLHFEIGSFRGVYQGGALKWLLKIVDRTKPTALVGLGDWGNAWTIDDWNLLTSMVTTHAIFGNHDNVDLLESVKNKDGSKILTHDGEIRNIEGIKFGFINGIMSDKGTPRRNVPRSTSEDFLRIASTNFKGIDILCTHESPIVPEYGKKFSSGIGPAVMTKVIEKVQPKISISGHLDFGPYTVSKIGQTFTIRIESGQMNKHYVVIKPDKNEVEIWSDENLREKLSII